MALGGIYVLGSLAVKKVIKSDRQRGKSRRRDVFKMNQSLSKYQELSEKYSAQFRDPAQIICQSQEGNHVETELLKFKATKGWWSLLNSLNRTAEPSIVSAASRRAVDLGSPILTPPSAIASNIKK